MSPELHGWTVIRGSSCDPDESPSVAAWVESSVANTVSRRLISTVPRAMATLGWWGSKAVSSAALAVISQRPPSVSRLAIEQHWLKRHDLPAPVEQLLDDKNESFIDSVADYLSDCSAAVVAAGLSIDPVWRSNWPWPLQIPGNTLIARTAAGDQQSVLRGCYAFEI
jgi:hypothetical protein